MNPELSVHVPPWVASLSTPWLSGGRVAVPVHSSAKHSSLWVLSLPALAARDAVELADASTLFGRCAAPSPPRGRGPALLSLGGSQDSFLLLLGFLAGASTDAAS